MSLQRDEGVRRTRGADRAACDSGEVVAWSYGEARVRIAEAIGRLEALPGTVAVREAAPREVAMACGFSRAMTSAVSGTRWVPIALFSRDELDPAAADFRAFVAGDSEIPLANMLAETEVARRRTAVLIEDTSVDRRTFKPIIEVARSTAYVVAPIVIGGRTIGFVHADRVGQEALVGEDDRKCIAAFAAALSVLYQRKAETERLAARRALLDRALAQARRTIDALSAEPSALVLEAELADHAPALVSVDVAPSRESLLTVREREVLDLVATGVTNAEIARRLSISDDTVKSHVSTVMRKLRVSSRGAAVARYLRIGPGDG